MGRAKALLTMPSGNVTFLARIVSVVLEGGAADALVVGRPDDRALRLEVERVFDASQAMRPRSWNQPAPPVNSKPDFTAARVRFVENHRADTGQLSSLIAGLNAADRPGVRAILVTPVDLPLIKPETVATLLAAFSSSSLPVARATHRGRHGHPVVFGRAVFDALRRADPDVGAKSVVRAHSVLDVEVEDPGVLQDVDTPDDYARLRSPEP
jgi:CTP:molybdopterin cytidylyltransferase MocA